MHLEAQYRVFLVFVTFTNIHRTHSLSLATGESIAHAIPFSDSALTGTASAVYTGISKVKCLAECSRVNCSSFNYGKEGKRCELHNTCICDNLAAVDYRLGFRYYDVEYGNLIELADTFRENTDCTTLGRCSPKCYLTSTTSSSSPPTTTTATTSTAATSTSAAASSTTTTMATTTTQPPTTTSASVLGPGDVNYACVSDTNCDPPISDCRNGVVCECVAGRAHYPHDNTCVETCPGNYGNTFHKTMDYRVEGNDMAIFNLISPASCKQNCIDTAGCVSFEYDLIMSVCFLANITRNGFDENWKSIFLYDYFERNCE